MKYLSLIILSFTLMTAEAQLSLDLEMGNSKADYGFSALRLTYQLDDHWQFGVESEHGYYRYRFIDARQVEDGFVGTYKLLAASRIAENDLLRFDFFLKPGLRIMGPPDESYTDFNEYDFQNSLAVDIEPGFLVTIKASERFLLHSGVNLGLSLQVTPEFVFEQYPSSYLLAGASYALGKHWAVYGQLKTGPASGASGDTEKFFWQGKAGLRYTFGKTSKQANMLIGY